MEFLAKTAWIALALTHAPPAIVLFRPDLAARLYGVGGEDGAGLLLTHRGALFLAIAALCVFSVFEPAFRRAASVAVSISVVSFLVLYVRAGAPAGPLRTVALVDAAALAPLLLTLWATWRPVRLLGQTA